MEAQLTELQEKVTFLDHEVSTLDAVIRDMHDRLDVLHREVQALRATTQRRLDEIVSAIEGEEDDVE